MNDVNEMIYELKNMIYNNTINKDIIIEVFEYLQSLQPKVPKFLADWYEANINIGVYNLVRLVSQTLTMERERLYDWFRLISLHDKDVEVDEVATQIFTRMYLFGYEVMEWN